MLSKGCTDTSGTTQTAQGTQSLPHAGNAQAAAKVTATVRSPCARPMHMRVRQLWSLQHTNNYNQKHTHGSS